MMMWIMTGARRNVGKTRVSHALAEILPSAVCAKIGHMPERLGRPKNYFTDVQDFLAFHEQIAESCSHCVVESDRFQAFFTKGVYDFCHGEFILGVAKGTLGITQEFLVCNRLLDLADYLFFYRALTIPNSDTS